MLTGPITYWWDHRPPDLTIPRNMVEPVNPEFAALLRLISAAKRVIPAGATYTVLAPNPDTEMALLSFSYADLPDSVPMPSSYYGDEHPGVGERARYVIAYQCDAQEARVRLILRIAEGCVFERMREAE